MPRLTESARAILARLEAEERDRAAGYIAFQLQRQEARAKIAAAADAIRHLEAAPLPSERELRRANAAYERAVEALARLEERHERTKIPVKTAARLRRELPRGVRYVDVPREFNAKPGESKRAALNRVRKAIAAAKADRKAVTAAPRPAADVKRDLREYLRKLEARGQPRLMDMCFGGAPEFPSVELPGNSPFIRTMPDGVAFAVWLVGADAVAEKLAPVIAFNERIGEPLSNGVRESRLAKIDAELERLGREEAALVEAIVSEGGTAFHRPDADPLHVLGLEIAESDEDDDAEGDESDFADAEDADA